MSFNHNKLLNSIHGYIEVPSLYPYFCNSRDKHEHSEIMLHFLDSCKSRDFGMWMWGINIPVNVTSKTSVINEWVTVWNGLARYQTVNSNYNEFQSLINCDTHGNYILKISYVENDEVYISYQLNREQAKEVLYIMSTAIPYNQDFVFIEC